MHSGQWGTWRKVAFQIAPPWPACWAFHWAQEHGLALLLNQTHSSGSAPSSSNSPLLCLTTYNSLLTLPPHLWLHILFFYQHPEIRNGFVVQTGECDSKKKKTATMQFLTLRSPGRWNEKIMEVIGVTNWHFVFIKHREHLWPIFNRNFSTLENQKYNCSGEECLSSSSQKIYI